MTRSLTAGPPVRVIVMFMLPLLVGNLFQQLYAVTDAMVVGRLLGVDALAAVGASGSLQFLLLGFSFGASAGVTIPVAKAFGAGDLPAMRRAVSAGAVVSAGVVAAITLIGTLGSRTLLTWMGTPPELMDNAATFLAVIFGGSAATVAFNFLSSVIRAVGDSRTPLIFLIISCVLNAGLVVLFIGVFGMGVGGAAGATILAQVISAVLCLALVARRMPDLVLHREDRRVSRAALGESARLGLTLGFQMSVIAVGAAVLQYGVNKLGTDAVAAFTTAVRVEQVAVAPMISIGVAMSTYVAQNLGAGELLRIRVGVFRISGLTLAMSAVLTALIIAFGSDLVRLFVGSGADDVVAMAHRYLVINASLYSVLALLFTVRNSLQGLGDATVPTIAGFMELIARATVGLFLIERIGYLGVCLAAPIAWVAALTPMLVAWMAHRRRMLNPDMAEFQEPAGGVALAS